MSDDSAGQGGTSPWAVDSGSNQALAQAGATGSDGAAVGANAAPTTATTRPLAADTHESAQIGSGEVGGAGTGSKAAEGTGAGAAFVPPPPPETDLMSFETIKGGVKDRFSWPNLQYRPRGEPKEEGHTFSYERHMTYKDRHGKPARRADAQRESLDQFLSRLGWRERDIEGHCGGQQRQYFRQVLDDHPWATRVAEIGFNAGHSAHTFLEHRDDVSVVSFDVMLHRYSRYSKEYIDLRFPGRHTMVAGDSIHSVPSYHRQHPAEKFDILFIDGDHVYEAALYDILAMRALAHERTVVIIDNVAPHRGVGRGVYYAWRELVEGGFLLHREHVETEGFMDGWTCGWYNFGQAPRLALPCGAPDYDHMERRVEICAIGRAMERAGSVEELDALQERVLALERQGGDRVDDWGHNMHAKMRAKLMRRSGDRQPAKSRRTRA